MFNGFYPRYDLEARIQHTKLDSWGYDIPSARMNRVEEVGMSKAELAISIATTATGKVIQAYDKIMQLQI